MSWQRYPTFISRLLFVAYFLEVGVLLLFLPWFPFWERNYFSDSLPWLGHLVRSPFVRGAVSGLGLVSIVAGLAELASLIFTRVEHGPDWRE